MQMILCTCTCMQQTTKVTVRLHGQHTPVLFLLLGDLWWFVLPCEGWFLSNLARSSSTCLSAHAQGMSACGQSTSAESFAHAGACCSCGAMLACKTQVPTACAKQSLNLRRVGTCQPEIGNTRSDIIHVILTSKTLSDIIHMVLM